MIYKIDMELLSIHWPKKFNNIEQNVIITQDIIPVILANITNNKNIFQRTKS